MKRNKTVLIASMSVLLLACLTGCEKDKRIVIKLGMWPESQLTQDVAMFTAWKTKFEEDHPEYRIDGVPYTYAQDTVASGALSQTLPTVFQTWFTEPKSLLIPNQYIRSIDDQVKELGWYDKIDAFMKETVTGDDGKLYGIPRDGYGFGMLLNLTTLEYYGILEDLDGDGKVDIYDDLGKPLYPTTFAELKAWSERINDESSGVTKGTFFYSSNKNGGWLFSNLAWNFGAELQKLDPNTGKYVATLNDPKAVEALEFIKSMKVDDLLPAGSSFVYTDWYSKIVSQVAIAFCGNDVIQLAITNGGLSRDEIAFVPMPKGPHGDHYSLFGGTPFVFSKYATDEQVKGALMFLEYMGRSPETSDISISAMRVGSQLAKNKGQPILPSIKPFINSDYVQAAEQIEHEFVNVNMAYFNDFYNSIYTIRHAEVPYYAQDMYRILDDKIQSVLIEGANADCAQLLEAANTEFNTRYMSKL